MDATGDRPGQARARPDRQAGAALAVPETAARHLGEFTGRQWVLERIDAWLAGTARRFLLTGPPGAGKSLVAARLVQISNGDGAPEGLARLGGGAVAHALFCRARDPWTQNPLSFVEALSGRLAALHDGFRAALLGSGRREITVSGEATAGTVAAGGTVIGVNVPVHIHDLAPVLAFDEAVRKPLAALGEDGTGRPVTVLVDALDEALQVGGGNLVELLAQVLHPDAALPASLRFVLTARSNEPRVLDALGPADLDLLAHAPADADDIGEHARRRLRVLAEPARSVLAARVAAQSRGNFLYAHHVLEDLRAHPGRVDDPATFRLPADLEAVYREFLTRELAPNRQDQDWRSWYRPVLALLTAARGDGLDLAVIASTAGRLAGRRVWESEAADAVGACAQFLTGPLPAGPVRIYHRSFHEFLLADPDLRTAHGEANLALAEHFIDEWSGDWEHCEDGYALLHTTAHLADAIHAAGSRAERRRLGARMTALLTEFGLLRAKLVRFGVRALLEDHRLAAAAGAAGEQALQPLQDALGLSAHTLDADPDQLAGQLLGRLVGRRDPALAGLLEQAGGRGGPWLCPVTASLAAPGGALRRVLRHDLAGAVTVSADGRRAVSSSRDGSVMVFDLDGRQPPRTLRQLDLLADADRADAAPGFATVAVSADGRRALSGCPDGTLQVWDLDGRQPPRALPKAVATLLAVAVSADGRRGVACAGVEPRLLDPYWFGVAAEFDLESGRELRVVRFGGRTFRCAAAAADGRRIVFGSLSRSGEERLEVAELDQAHEAEAGPDHGAGAGPSLLDGLSRTIDHGREVTAVAVTPDGRRAVACSAGPRLSVFDLDSGRGPLVLGPGAAGREAGAPATALAVSLDGRRALTAAFDGSLRVWDLDGAGLQHTLLHGGPVMAAALAADGTRAVSVSPDGTLKVWDLGGSADAAGPAPPGADAGAGTGVAAVTVVAVTPDGRRAVTGAMNGRVVLWDRDDGWAARTLQPAAPGRLAVSLAIAPDGRRACGAAMDGSVTVWDLDGARADERLPDLAEGVVTAGVTPDGRRAAFTAWAVRGPGPADGAEGPQGFVVRDLGGDPERRVVGDGEEEAVRDLTPDGRYAVTTPSSSHGGTIKVWDLDQDGPPTLLRHGKEVETAVVTAGGRRVLSSSLRRTGPAPSTWESTIKVWDLERGCEVLMLTLRGGVGRLAVTPDGRWLFSPSADGSLRVWDLTDGAKVASFTADSAITAVAVAAGDGVLAVCGDMGGAVHVLQLRW
jgi:WD40 repeat protein